MRYATFAIIASSLTFFYGHKLIVIDEAKKTEALKKTYPQRFVKVNKVVKKVFGVKSDEMLRCYYIELFASLLYFLVAAICLIVFVSSGYENKVGYDLFFYYAGTTGIVDLLVLVPMVIYNRKKLEKTR